MFKKSVNKKKLVVNRAEVLTDKQPFPYKEAYKSLRANLNFATQNGKVKSILVTSAISAEGKTTVSINLAISLIESGKKVLLIDADLRNPSVHRHLRVRQDKYFGLSNLLSSGELIGKSIRHMEKYNLDILMSGEIPPNPAELLGNGDFKSILKAVDTSYDYVIIDTPPVGIVSDAAVLSQFVDGVLMVVAQNKSTQNQVLTAKQNLERVNANVIGAILNNYDMRLDNKNSGEDYYYYYGNE